MPDPNAGATYLFGAGVPGGTLYVADKLRHPGKIFWVDSATGVNASGRGGSPAKAVATDEGVANVWAP